jgi:addiction module HigA family antidote
LSVSRRDYPQVFHHEDYRSPGSSRAVHDSLRNNEALSRDNFHSAKPLGLSVNKLALELHVPATRIGEIVHERRRITAETALRLARYFKTNAEFWLNLQNFYDL